MLNAIITLINLSREQHRVIQSCTVVCFCITVIIWALVFHSNDPGNTVTALIVNWAFGCLLGTVGAFHISTVIWQRAAGMHVVHETETDGRRETWSETRSDKGQPPPPVDASPRIVR